MKYGIKEMAKLSGFDEAYTRTRLRKAGLKPRGEGGVWGWDSDKAMKADWEKAGGSKKAEKKSAKPAKKVVKKPAKKPAKAGSEGSEEA